MTDTTRDLIRQPVNALEVPQKEAVTTIPINCRALCIELLDKYDLEWRARERLKEVLAQPEPEGLTDEEILNLSQEHQVSYTMCDGGVIYPLQAGADMKDDVLSFARALIAADRARWGRPAVEPVPASERLPGPEDCDTEGRCWWFRGDSPILNAYWDLSKGDSADPVPPTEWLPHHALPVPTTPTEPNGQT